MARTRSRSPKKKLDEARFPIRVRVAVPEEGLGNLLDELVRWLDLEAGCGNWAENSDTLPRQDAMSIYLKDPALVAPMLANFGLELVVNEETS